MSANPTQELYKPLISRGETYYNTYYFTFILVKVKIIVSIRLLDMWKYRNKTSFKFFVQNLTEKLYESFRD